MPAPSTRRRFLAGTAGALAVLAGCNEQSSPSRQGTVTPVDVPQTDEELLQEAANIDVPSVPKAVIVSESHHQAAIDHIESVRSAVESVLADSDIEPENYDGVRYGTPKSILDSTEKRLEDVRDLGRTEQALRVASNTLRELSRLLGVLQAETGAADAESLRSELEAERDAIDALPGQFDYCVATPVERYLPTLYAAESKLDNLTERPFPTRAETEEADDEAVQPSRIGELRLHLEYLRRQRDDVEQFHATATDESAPSIRDRIDDALTGLEPDIRSIVEEHGTEAPEQPGGSGRPGETRFRSVRQSVSRQGRRWATDLDDYREDGLRVLALVDATEWLVLFEAVDTAVDRTLARLEADDFPAETIPTEKRRAAEAVTTVAEGTALQRQLAGRAHGLLRNGDRHAEREVAITEETAFAHLLYVSAAECARQGVARSGATLDTLEG
ncbi:hypothetical protein [Natronomonas gomsonensis]|uniref:hypothetical protein n=1 Tax=Natronomonas gomsonensis TaxID=1046043 RepID=UPI0015C01F83|nr:hypothetical protein [Natronomonas gomsonensis]